MGPVRVFLYFRLIQDGLLLTGRESYGSNLIVKAERDHMVKMFAACGDLKTAFTKALNTYRGARSEFTRLRDCGSYIDLLRLFFDYATTPHKALEAAFLERLQHMLAYLAGLVLVKSGDKAALLDLFSGEAENKENRPWTFFGHWNHALTDQGQFLGPVSLSDLSVIGLPKGDLDLTTSVGLLDEDHQLNEFNVNCLFGGLNQFAASIDSPHEPDDQEHTKHAFKTAMFLMLTHSVCLCFVSWILTCPFHSSTQSARK